jgi:hypothetical protein
MSSREADFAAVMTADSTLMLVLTGGVYQSGVLGEDGITRASTPAAFSTYLLPCCMVKQRGNVPDNHVRSYDPQATSAVQVIELWLYCDKDAGYAPLDAASDRLYTLFEGHRFTNSFEVQLSNTIDRQRDQGALKGASLKRLDFATYSVMIPS